MNTHRDLRARRGLMAAASAMALLAMSAGAAAAQQAPTPSQDPGTSSTVDDVIVTAQRRSQNLQDVPIAVSAVTAEMAETKGIRQLDDLNVAVPGVNISRTTGAAIPFIRGVGSNTANPGVEPPVAFYIDGIYSGSATANVANFNNVDHIEVLKGPQGTLFGRNTTGGIIQIVTLDPSQTFRARAKIGYANYDTIYGNAYITGGLTDRLAADLSVYYSDQGQGWGTNLFDGSDTGLRSDWGVRTKWKLDLSDATKITFSADYNHTEDTSGDARQVLPGITYGGAYTGITSPADPYDVNLNSAYGSEIVNKGGYLRVDHDFGGVRFLSLTGYRYTNRQTFLDLDSTQLNRSSAAYDPEITKAWSQEFQLLSAADSKVQWIAGLFYYDSTAGFYPLQINNSALGAALYQRITTDIQTKSYAAFAQATFPIFSDATNLTIGARYTKDDKSVDGDIRTALAPLLTGIHQENSWKEPTYRVSLDHKLTEDVMVYGSISTGFKSGIYIATAPQAPAVNPETVTSYEIGIKSQFLDNRARLNIAGFYAEYSDLQLTRFTGTTSVLLNAAQAEVRGMEAEGQFVVNDNLTLNASLALLHSEYTSFPGAVSFVTSPTTGLGTQTVFDASGNTIMRAPEMTSTLGFDYHVTNSVGDEFGLNMNWYHNDGFFFEIDNQYKQDAYDIVSAEGRWLPAAGRWGVRVWAKNLFDELYWGNIQTSSGNPPARLPAAPRTFGISLDVNF